MTDADVYTIEAPHPYNPHIDPGKVEITLKVDDRGIVAEHEHEYGTEHRSFVSRGTLTEEDGEIFLELHRIPKMSKVDTPRIQIPEEIAEEIPEEDYLWKGKKEFELLGLDDYPEPRPSAFHTRASPRTFAGWPDTFNEAVDIYVVDAQINVRTTRTGIDTVGRLKEVPYRMDTAPAIVGVYELRDGKEREFKFTIRKDTKEEISGALREQREWRKEARDWLKTHDLLFEVRSDIEPIKQIKDFTDKFRVLLPNKPVDVLDEDEKNLLEDVRDVFVAEGADGRERLANRTQYPVVSESFGMRPGEVYTADEVREKVDEVMRNLDSSPKGGDSK